MKEYPTFKKGEVKNYYNRLSLEEKKIIENFLKFVSITAQSSKRIDNTRRSITEFRYIIKKPLDKTTLEDLRNFLSLLNSSNKTQSTRNDLKHTTKRFLKWLFKDWSKRFDNLSDIRMVMRMNEEKINSETILKKEDIEEIVKREPKLYWKTFFITLYESGLRPIELRTLRWSNVHLSVEGDISEINIFATKTHRTRSVYVKEATRYLLEHKKRLQEQGNNNDLVFPSPKDKAIPLSKNTACFWIRNISQKVLGRSIYPYILRHTRATELYTNADIPDKIAQKFLGHSKSMGDVYTHLSNKNVKEAVSKTIYNFEELTPKQKSEVLIKVDELESKLNHLAKYLPKDLKIPPFPKK